MDEDLLPRRALLLACAWAWLLALPLCLAALRGDGVEQAFAQSLALATGLLPVLWAQTSAGRPLAEGMLLAAVSTPAFTLLAAFAAARARAAGLLYAVAVLLNAGLLVRCCGRRARVAVAGALGLALPFGLRAWADVAGDPPAWTAAWALPMAATGIADGARLAPPLLCLAALWGVAGAAVMVRRRRARAGGAGTLAPPAETTRVALAFAVTLCFGLGVAGAWPLSAARAAPGVEALLGPHARPGEPYPLLVREGERPFAARSLSHRFAAGAGAGGGQQLFPTPLGAGNHLALERQGEDGSWERAALEVRAPRPVGGDALLVGWLGDEAGPLAGSVCAGLEARLVQVRPDTLPLLAAGGQALDALVLGRGAAPLEPQVAALRAWTAAGGVLVCEARADLERVCSAAPAWAPASGRALTQRWLGAGRALGPGLSAPGERAAQLELSRALSSRPSRRARRANLVELGQLEDEPRPAARAITRAALALLAVALAATLLLLGARRPAPITIAGAWVGALALALLIRALVAPATPVYATSVRVLEVPMGARVAQRLEVLTLGSLRPAEASVDLAGLAPPLPCFLTALEAIRSAASLQAAGERAPPRLRLPLTPAHPRSFTRLDACELDGEVLLTPDALEDRAGLPLRDVLLVDDEGIRALGDVEPGARLPLAGGTPEPLGEWRHADVPLLESRRRRFVAALAEARVPGARLIVARIPPRSAVASGVAGESATRWLVVHDRAP
ncbi:MAG: hypothetical protein AB7N76_22980 [Planctomycetota bacterium]